MGISSLALQILPPVQLDSNVVVLSDPALYLSSTLGPNVYAMGISLLVLTASMVVWRGLRASWWIGFISLLLFTFANIVIIYIVIRMVILSKGFISHLLSLLFHFWPTLLFILFKMVLITYLFKIESLSWFGLDCSPIPWTIRRG